MKKTATKRRSRNPKATGAGVRKIGWTRQEDERLLGVLNDHDLLSGKISWISISNGMAFRNAKQCRLRWYNHLRPDVNRGTWTDQEKLTLFELQQEFCPLTVLHHRWTVIAKTMRRSEGDVKNRWNTKGFRELRKALAATSVQRMAQLIVAGKAGFPVDLLSGSIAIGASTGGIAFKKKKSVVAFEDSSNFETEYDPNYLSESGDETQPDRLFPSKNADAHRNKPCRHHLNHTKPVDMWQDGKLQVASLSITTATDALHDEILISKFDDDMQDGDDDSIVGLVAQDMARELPPLSIAPSPSWDADDDVFEKFDIAPLVFDNVSAAYQWPTPNAFFLSPDTRVKSGGTPRNNQSEAAVTPNAYTSYFAKA